MNATRVGQRARRRGAIRITLLAAALLAVAGTSGGCKPNEPPQILRTWPATGTPRIVLRKVIHGAQDVEPQTGLAAFIRNLAGPTKQVIRRPQGIAVDDRRRLFVVDQENQGVHVLDLDKGEVHFIDRAGKTAFVSPVAAAWCDGKLAVSDNALKQVFWLDASGKLLGTVNAPGGWRRPTGLAWDSTSHELYVVDTVTDEVLVFGGDGQLVRKFGQPGTGPGQFNAPTHLSVAPGGPVLVADSLNYRIQLLDRTGKPLLAIGKQGDASGHMGLPKGVGIDALGHLYVADSGLAAVQIFDQKGDLLLGVGERGSGVGEFEIPTGMAVRGNMIYVSDYFLSRVLVFEYVGGEDDHEQAQ
ncbi:MAG: hypothetical protein BIFFINMI_03143 [Phycisphaerae bacterium]|nr:hypothetical protein [Phycisphaerae bacterium]